MKKLYLLPLFAALLSSLLLTSCEKRRDWTCACNVGGKATSDVILDQKEDDARGVCDGVVNTARSNKVAATCTLTEKE